MLSNDGYLNQTEMPAPNRTGIRLLDFLQRFLAQRYLPALLAIGAILVMLPALWTGLGLDDLPQRSVELRPDRLPPRMHEIGNPADSGSLPTVLFDLFGLSRDPQCVAVMKNYGTLPWWTPDDLKLSLCRPVAAFTHWLDYRLYPDSPALMHAHNIAWFAAVVFLVTMVYRKLDVTSGGAGRPTSQQRSVLPPGPSPGPHFAGPPSPDSPIALIRPAATFSRPTGEGHPAGEGHRLARSPGPPYSTAAGTGWAAGLAGFLFLLDGSTYFPVTFVANRGFIMALFFGLLCLYEHHQWRSTKSRPALALSVLALALSVFAEEGGASTFAFIVAYALVLEPGSVRHRALTLLPSVLVLVLWRAIYILAGYGLSQVGVFYIDPLNEPFRFAVEGLPRVMVVLGSQLTAVPPEWLLAVKPSLQPASMAFYGVCVAAALAVFLPWVRRDKTAVFWLAATVLAAIPESSLVPLSKNFGFVAVGTYGLIASFVAGVMTRRLPERPAYRRLAWIACVLLLLVHIPGAIAGRIATVKVVDGIFAWARRVPPTWPNIGNQNVIVVNHPLPMESAYVPAYAAYYHQVLPKTLRVLVPGCTGFNVQRADDKTLIIQSQGPDIFSGDEAGPVDIVYALSWVSRTLPEPRCRKGDRYSLNGLTVEVLESDAAGLASRVVFRFDVPLDSPDYRWLWFNWRTHSSEPFKLPAIGQSVVLPGPSH